MTVIVTDSSAGYTAKEAAELGIRTVPLSYMVDGNMREEKPRGENGNFIAEFRKAAELKTSQPPQNAFTELFKEITGRGDEVLCIVLSSGLSGTYSSAVSAAKQVEGSVCVMDSGTSGSALHMLVDEAVNMVVGGMPVKEITENLKVLRDRIGTVFSVETMEPLRQGGRYTASGAANTALNTRPLFGLRSKIKFIKNERGLQARVDGLLEKLPESVRRIFVMKAGEDTDISMLVQACREKYPSVRVHQRTVGPVLTVHVGEGAFGVAYLSRD